jgi:hypothetical protein
MATLDELNAGLDRLIAARSSGELTIEYAGRRTTYRSIAELNSAIAQQRAEIEAAGGAEFVRSFRFTSSKDL